MGRPTQHTDADVVAAIAEIRREKAACTVQELATKLGLSKSSTHARVQRLVEEGLVQNTGVPGGIRPLVTVEHGALQLNLLVQVDPKHGTITNAELAGS